MSDDLPLQVDLRNLIGPARDQGRRGTCVAFSTTTCHESRRADGDLSEEAVFWGAMRFAKSRKGISLLDASLALSSDGQPERGVWPYREDIDEDGAPPDAAESCRPWWTCRLERIAVDVDRFRGNLAEGHPIAIIVPLFDELYTPVGNRIEEPASPVAMGNHAVVLVGYDDASGRFIVRNSWGTEWGELGNVWMSYSFIQRFALDAAIVSSERPDPPCPSST